MCSKYLVLLWLAINILHLDLKVHSIYLLLFWFILCKCEFIVFCNYKTDLWLWIISTRVLYSQNYWWYLIGDWMIFFFLLNWRYKKASTLNFDGIIWWLTNCYLELLSFDSYYILQSCILDFLEILCNRKWTCFE